MVEILSMATRVSPESQDSALARLGAELQQHADEIAEAVLDWWLVRRRSAEPPDPRAPEDILRTVRLGAIATGRYLMTGELPSSEERDRLSAPGKAALTDSIAVDELTKLYLATRDITCQQLAEFADRLGVGRAELEVAKAVVWKGNDSAIVGVVRKFDAARRHLQEQLASERELLAHHAVHDSLTGLPNRTLLMDRLERLLPSAGRAPRSADRRRPNFAVLFIDVDRFKAVNDVAGHHVGDELLVAVAGRLGAVIRDGDTLARLGGDEFVVLCPDLTEPASEATAVAERITAVMARPFCLAGAREEFFLSASVGVGVAAPGDTAESILSRADAAMYSAKRRGGSSHDVFDDSIDSTLRRRPQLINDLHSAADNGQLSLHYQPVMHLGTDRVCSMEALARWEHPQFGAVAPDEFIPLAEESGLIVEIGRWVISRAFADCAGWQADKPGVAVAVNVSGRQFADAGLADHVAATLAATGLSPSEVILEITESVVIGNEASTAAALEALRKIGVRLAIDDFGTGYSSLAYLRQLPVQSVKVDRSFIAGIDAAEADIAFVAAMVDLAHSLGLEVVAEGVETAAELEVVRRTGCDDAQGYLLGRPAVLDRLGPLLDSASCPPARLAVRSA